MVYKSTITVMCNYCYVITDSKTTLNLWTRVRCYARHDAMTSKSKMLTMIKMPVKWWTTRYITKFVFDLSARAFLRIRDFFFMCGKIDNESVPPALFLSVCLSVSLSQVSFLYIYIYRVSCISATVFLCLILPHAVPVVQQGYMCGSYLRVQFLCFSRDSAVAHTTCTSCFSAKVLLWLTLFQAISVFQQRYFCVSHCPRPFLCFSRDSTVAHTTRTPRFSAKILLWLTRPQAFSVFQQRYFCGSYCPTWFSCFKRGTTVALTSPRGLFLCFSKGTSVAHSTPCGLTCKAGTYRERVKCSMEDRLVEVVTVPTAA